MGGVETTRMVRLAMLQEVHRGFKKTKEID
jgi:hypothetical protein